MNDYRHLGKKVEPIPTGEVIEDEYERFKGAHGPLWRNKRTNQLSTDKPEKPIDWKAINDAIDRMKQEGIDICLWGTW